MTKVTSAAQVLKKIGNSKLNLFKGEGYWYFVYDDEKENVWLDESVLTMYLSHLTLEQWIEIAESFLGDVAKHISDREIFKS